MPTTQSAVGGGRRIACPDCNGAGVHVVGNGHWPDGSERNDEIQCSSCEGIGSIALRDDNEPARVTQDEEIKF